MADSLIVIEKRMSGDIKGTYFLADELLKCRTDIATPVSFQNKQLPAKAGGLFFGDRIGKLRSQSNFFASGPPR